MMELKYAVSLKMPVVVVPVGSGNRWDTKVTHLVQVTGLIQESMYLMCHCITD